LAGNITNGTWGYVAITSTSPAQVSLVGDQDAAGVILYDSTYGFFWTAAYVSTNSSWYMIGAQETESYCQYTTSTNTTAVNCTNTNTTAGNDTCGSWNCANAPAGATFNSVLLGGACTQIYGYAAAKSATTLAGAFVAFVGLLAFF